MRIKSASLRGGFRGGRIRQGGWITAVLGLATSLFGASRASKERKKQEKLQREAIEASDPYAPYRKDAATRLNALSADTVTSSEQFKTREQAVERVMAAQGYTGSGNALIEASRAGGEAYQQEFENLARMAGIDKQPGAGYNLAASGQNSANYLSTMSDVANSVTYNAGRLWDAWSNRGSDNTKG